ncbi:sensor histidine kinase [Mahella australiensis]|uniref:histidine kinase n=1 Tax=Mahella australiensis (strain DSM 15567 / CIP 107919 / 50-1 BON) TaxID=697281 RepID=F3ZWG4_MAHA5|nr:sensor histidine kinase [Mahella australiensis]AEE95399.1 histidine kinase [Mahella australiensis 50-1 BON]
MKHFACILGLYLKQKITTIIVIAVSFSISLVIFYLYALPLEPVAYAALLAGIFLLLIGIIEFVAFYSKHMVLEKLKDSIAVSDLMLPNPQGLIERDYQGLIRAIHENRREIINEKDKALADMTDYYTIWAHQIKIPIAAMQLLLQSKHADINGELSDQLFKVEQYVEMALQYLRTESLSGDLMLKRYSLDDMVKQAVRKYSKSFIHKKIKLDYNGLNHEVLTDEKWTVFVIEQILSNALKYTDKGEISIYMDSDSPDTLVIEDTGIGIESEDLPRIFEKGFTGYNGRLDKKSTGIGLYLCKRILSKLSHTISIESQVGKGTKVKIGFGTVDIAAD